MSQNSTCSVIFTIACFFVISVFYSCTKDSSSVKSIQQGNTTIEILPIYTTATPSTLIIKYNNVIDAPINATVTFYLRNGEKHDVPVSIPAGYKDLESWGSNKYLNAWYYTNYYDSTSGGQPSTSIDGSWDVDRVGITAVSCPDKNYGFKVLVPADDWTYYQPTDPVTLLSFISNQDTVVASDYDFNASGSMYYGPSSTYSFNFNSIFLQMFSAASIYPLQAGLEMDIPYFRYYWNNRNYGSQSITYDPSSNGSTLKLTITEVTDTHYNATFSGKVWSPLQPDTLFISNGNIENALLPVKAN